MWVRYSCILSIWKKLSSYCMLKKVYKSTPPPHTHTHRKIQLFLPPLKSSFSSSVAFDFCSDVISKKLRASSWNSLCRVTLTFSPGSTIPPGIAHWPLSRRLMQTNCSIGFLLASEVNKCSKLVNTPPVTPWYMNLSKWGIPKEEG